MGTRIHKCMGWGMKKSENYFKVEGRTYCNFKNNNNLNFQEFNEWSEKNLKEILAFHNEGVREHDFRAREFGDKYIWGIGTIKQGSEEERNRWRVLDFIHDSTEETFETILLRPISQNEWFRYDSMMDYYESNRCVCGKFKLIKHAQGIFPWEGMYPIVHFPKDYRVKGYNPYSPSEYSMLIGAWDKKAKPRAEGVELKSLIRDWRPNIPLDVTVLVWWMRDNLKDPVKFARDLRPAIYEYWC